jgi:two-component system, chemotaxis family, chemotaxis protein CheY
LTDIPVEKINIIIVEDQPEVLQAISKDLRSLEDILTVEECQSAAEAMDVMRDIEANGDFVAVIISDHIMPQKTGVDFLAEIHQDQRFNGTRKILLTGLATHNDTINAINKASIDHYLSKPWKGGELLEIVTTLLSEFIFDKGIPYEKFLGFLDEKVVFERLRKSTA